MKFCQTEHILYFEKMRQGYYPHLGLTFEGDGEVTGFEKIKER